MDDQSLDEHYKKLVINPNNYLGTILNLSLVERLDQTDFLMINDVGSPAEDCDSELDCLMIKVPDIDEILKKGLLSHRTIIHSSKNLDQYGHPCSECEATAVGAHYNIESNTMCKCVKKKENNLNKYGTFFFSRVIHLFFLLSDISQGYLNEPFYHKNYPKYINYGSLGSIIGHEIAHSFDPNTLINYFSPDIFNYLTNRIMYKEFDSKKQCFIEKYQYESTQNLKISVSKFQMTLITYAHSILIKSVIDNS